MDSTLDNLVISSRNPGYIATLSSVFEVKGVDHRLEVDRGWMRVVVPFAWVETAEEAMSEFGLYEQSLLPPPRFNHLTVLSAEELEVVIGQPEIWKKDEIEAARQIQAVKISTRQKAIDMINRVPLAFVL